MSEAFKVSDSEISENRSKMSDFAKQQGLDAIYVSSFDPFISEYVPRQECHRYYVTGFTGSVAESLVLANGKTRLYVDGRYHEQADKEVNLDEVEVVKVGANISLRKQLLDDLKTLSITALGFQADRTPLSYVEQFSKGHKLTGFYQLELHQVINFASYTSKNPIEYIDAKYRGSDTNKKVERMALAAGEAYFVTAIDQVSWIANSRGYHLPNLSSFLGRALVTKEKVFIFVEPSTILGESLKNNFFVEFIGVKSSELEIELKKYTGITKLNYSPSMNAQDFRTISNIFGSVMAQDTDGLIPFMSIKEASEIKEMEASFKRSSLAVFNTLKWVKDHVEAGETVTELDLFNKTDESYRAQGATELSFSSIAAVGANGSIIHFGGSSADVVIKKDDLCLLDSGAYYEGGFATDKTRAFLASHSATANPRAKEIYTMVLKGVMACESALFPPGTKGNALDALARFPMHKKGYNYAHGTGHGVGVHVHEGGVRLSTLSDVPMREGQVTSIEPGIYIPGFGGVRLENVCAVERHPIHTEFLHFRPLNLIGYDWSLIDESLLSSEEKEYLEAYEKKCVDFGTSFREL
jgi:Xaa-Pro aminopeptidase